MKHVITLAILLLFIASCADEKENIDTAAEQFTAELLELKDYFRIPGLAVSIERHGEPVYREYFGTADIEKGTPLDTNALFPIASITKVFSGVLLMKLVEQEKLSLDTPINTFLPKPVLGDSVLVKHVLSHTSQGDLGQHFYYSSRFGLLTYVIEQSSGQSFSELMDQEILTPLQLKNTFLLKDSTQIAGIAKPYLLDDGITPGFIDYGYSTSAGIVSDLEDLARFNQALDDNQLLSQASKDLMFSSFGEGLPYGYGIFHQQFEQLDIVWAYGQYDCYSSLLLKIPSQDITLTLLANSNLLSDPARLIYGDVTSSLFALSFLKNYVFGLPEMPLFEQQDSISGDFSNPKFHKKKILAQALAESFMARHDTEKQQTSAKLLKSVFATYPDYLEEADLNLLHTLSFLKDVAFYKELGPFTDFDPQIEAIGTRLLAKEPNNPYAHMYLGSFYSRKGSMEKAQHHFERIVQAKNFSENWYTHEAKQWLDEN